MTHEVVVPCNCDDIEHCRMELYVSDVRTLLVLYGDPKAERPRGIINANATEVQAA